MSTFPDVPVYAEPHHEVLLVAGSRADVARLAPITRAIAGAGRIHPTTVAAGADPITVLDAFESLGVEADITLLPGQPAETTAAEAASLLNRVDDLLRERQPAAVLVSGGGTTAGITAQVAFWQKVPVVHLQTGATGDDLLSPFPQEANRRIIGQLASLFLLTAGPTGLGTPAGPNAIVIGDPVVAGSPPADPALAGVIRRARSGRPLVTVAVAEDLRLWQAAAELPGALLDTEIVAVSSDIDFSDLLALLSATSLLITDDIALYRDSTGLGTLTLVVDPDARVDDLPSALVGPEPRRVVRAARQLLDRAAARSPARQDGHAAHRAEQALAWMFGLQPSLPAIAGAGPNGTAVTGIHHQGAGEPASEA